MVTLLDLLTADPELLNNIALPEEMDRETLVNQILFEGCTLYPIYQDPILFKRMVEHYFTMRLQIHEELAKTLEYSYNPLENYDRIEDRKRTGSGTESYNRNRHLTGNATTEEQVSAYNESSYQPQSKTITDTADSDDDKLSRKTGEEGSEYSRIHGNIGVTTSQQMLEDQRRVVKFSLYEFIAAHFLKTFMIGLY